MPITIRTTGFDEFLDPSGGSYIKALVMGAAGAGKTRSASFWPKPIFADCEKGLMSVADRGVPYVHITKSGDMDSLLETLRQDGLKPPLKRQYQTLVIDTLDSYQRVLIQERLRAEKKESLSGWGDWGFLDAKMSQLIERMLNLPMNVVVNLHVKDEKDSDGETEILVKKARLKGDIKDAIFQDFDLIGQMETAYAAEQGERVLKRFIRWHAEPRFPVLRDRSGKLPRFTDVDFTEQDFYRIFEAITSGLDNLPESTDVETLSTEGDDDVAPADAKGGPVAEPKIPAKKAAKKAPAKKAAAKKAEPKPDPQPEPEGSTEALNDLQDAISLDNGEGGKAVAEATKLLEEELGATPVEEDPGPVPDETPVVTQKPEEKGEISEAAPVAKKARSCGDQPDSMVGKFAPHEGCGIELSAENAGRASLAMLKFKTYLCDECFEKAKAAA